jgi:hypothetical protein
MLDSVLELILTYAARGYNNLLGLSIRLSLDAMTGRFDALGLRAPSGLPINAASDGVSYYHRI